jgi:hypothetical protein
MIKSFRGILADGDQQKIRLSTIRGEIGYYIRKFEAMGREPGAKTLEGSCKIFTHKQDTVDNVVDFSNSELLAALEYHKEQNTAYPVSTNVIFDNVPVNQDIFVTWKDNASGESLNYYLELEQVTLKEIEATVATLKDMRADSNID